MAKYCALAFSTKFWRPGADFLNEIIDALSGRVENGDYLVISEKALSTACGNIVDENHIQPSLNAKLIARWWMRICWGYFFSALLGFGQRLIRNLREYPLDTGSRHKQLALEEAGPLQALLFGSEGGIDGSNLPYAYVSLPLENAVETAVKIQKSIYDKLRKKITVIIVDTDKTYTFRNFHFTPRPRPMHGIHSHGGILSYLIGRMLKLRKRPTPLAVVGEEVSAEEALRISNVADKTRGTGSGTTVWKMAKRFGVEVNGVTWSMLSGISHKPVVLVRRG